MRRLLAGYVLTLALAFALAAGRPAHAAESPSGEPRLVFAHYMVCCAYPTPQGGVEAFRDEIERAMRHGIDGFVLNAGAWSTHGNYPIVAEKLFAAADQLGGRFKLFFSADFATKLTVDDAADMVTRFRSRPSYYHYRGRPALTSFIGSAQRFESIREKIRSAGADPFIFANIRRLTSMPLPGKLIETPTPEIVDLLVAENRALEGYLFFGTGGTPQDITIATRAFGTRLREAGIAYMAPVTPYYRGHGPNNRLFDSRGFLGMAQQWEAAIEAEADLVQVITWNDWGESSYVFPFQGELSEDVWKGHWGTLRAHDGFLEASRYYIDWYKQGRPPETRTETVSYFYIPHPKSLLPAVAGAEPAPRNHQSLEDRFYVFSNLSAASTLTIRNGDRTSEIRLPAGIHHDSVELAAGAVEIEAGGEGWRAERKALPPFGVENRRGSYNYLAGSLHLARETPPSR